MKRLIIASLVFLLIFGCLGETPEDGNQTIEPPEDNISQNISENVTQPVEVSKCASYSEGPRKVVCYAMETENMSMCAEIEGGPFLEECVIIMAELVYNESNVQYCDLSQTSAYQKMCRALTLEDMDECFNWGQGEGLGAALTIRDCVDLVSRKARDPEFCDMHIHRSPDIYYICGETQDCDNQFMGLGAEDNAAQCKEAVMAAMEE